MHVSRKSALFAVALAALLGLATSGTASAVGWGTLSSFYNGATVVKGSGSFVNSGNVSARTDYSITDAKADGNTVYGQTNGYLYDTYAGSAYSFRSFGTKVTPEHQNATKSYSTSYSLSNTGTKARGAVQVCAQMGWPIPNSCSTAAYPTFDY